MDESFDLFLHDEGFAPAFGCRPVSEETFNKYRGKLPDKLLEYWREFGFCGCGEGRLWMVDPSTVGAWRRCWLPWRRA